MTQDCCRVVNELISGYTAGEWREGKRYGEGIANYAPGANPSPFYDGNWEYDEPVEVYPMSIHAGH